MIGIMIGTMVGTPRRPQGHHGRRDEGGGVIIGIMIGIMTGIMIWGRGWDDGLG